MSLLLKMPPRPTDKTRESLAGTSVAVVVTGRQFARKSLSASRFVFPAVERSPPQEKYDPRDALNVPDDPFLHGEAIKIAKFIVRDLHDRAVNLRFRCRVLSPRQASSTQLHGLGSSLSTKSTVGPLNPRMPRVAKFDDAPFAEVAVIQCSGFSDSAQTQRQSRSTGTSTSLPRSATLAVRLLRPDTTYVTVSTLAFFPQNSDEEVEAVAEAFGYDLNAAFQLDEGHDANAQIPFPTPCTVRTALTEFIELRTITREFLRVASGYVATAEERQLLENLASMDGSSAFTTQSRISTKESLTFWPSRQASRFRSRYS